MFKKLHDFRISKYCSRILKEKSAKLEIFSAMLLGPFEQLEREFGSECDSS
jgi:hypothetical protein